jgi:hypothetical protein
MNVMLSDYRRWLEYDSVALAVLLAGIGFVELIVLSIWQRGLAISGTAVLSCGGTHFATPLEARKGSGR